MTAIRRFSARSIRQQIYHIYGMNLRAGRMAAYLCAAGFLYASFIVGTAWSDAYVSQYGNFLLSRGELAFKLNLVLFILPAILFASAALAEIRPRRLLAKFDSLEGGRLGHVRLITLALIALGIVMLIRVYVLRESVITDDENVYHFQAQLLASGRLYASSMPESIRSFFDNQFIVNNGRWFGMYFLGHSFVLAAFQKVGLIRWAGAIEAALTLLLAAGIARRIFGDRVATLTPLLLVVSPFFIFVSATHLSQPSSMLFLNLFVYAALRIEESATATRWWSLAAIAMVCAVFTRPQIGISLALPFMIRLAWVIARGAVRPGWVPPVVAFIILGCGAAVFLGVNHALTGNVLRTGYHAYWDQGHKWTFPIGPAYTVREISQNLAQLNFWLFGWPISLAFVPFFERIGRAWALASVPILALFWFGLVGVPTVAAVGPVYYAETIVPLVILTASGLERVVALARDRLGETRLTHGLITAPIVAVVASFLAFVPFQAASLGLMADVTQAPYDLVESRGLQNALVFVHSLPSMSVAPGSWAYYHRNNSPDLSDRVLFVRDLGPEKDRELMRYLPERTPYRMQMKDGQLVLLSLER
jgi:dolichyl-phosphate-mannose-protein mannosyltransferase